MLKTHAAAVKLLTPMLGLHASALVTHAAPTERKQLELRRLHHRLDLR
jgi:hypothetical protein